MVVLNKSAGKCNTDGFMDTSSVSSFLIISHVYNTTPSTEKCKSMFIQRKCPRISNVYSGSWTEQKIDLLWWRKLFTFTFSFLHKRIKTSPRIHESIAFLVKVAAISLGFDQVTVLVDNTHVDSALALLDQRVTSAMPTNLFPTVESLRLTH